MKLTIAAGILTLSALSAGMVRADVTVFAAASLAGPLDAVADAFSDDTGEDVVVSYAGSAILARQIAAGAPADVFISANIDWMDVLENEAAIDAVSRVDLLGNALVLIGGPTALPFEIEMLPEQLGSGRLAMALVDAVPAGVYGKAALVDAGIWGELETRVAQTDNVRAALALVAQGAAPFGIVYRTDAIAEPRVRIVAEFTGASHPDIVYPAARVRGGDDAGFLAYLQSETARAIFGAAGFTMPEK
ncbi:molybdate ABC transporter substrate-binding protein [Celeribacter arenosi]|uniref:Molybdate ABC transporter substrate-binding protein n=1 Tax=Celeribacter arenosi TaxID=792649 RepID=A0ABP7JSH1_9RHOB